MPDACPSGGGRATIPVGGAIEVENAIIPGAHSADICCSMFATFFPANHPVGEMMDHLQRTTHYGPGGRPRGFQMTSPVLDEPVWDNPFLSGLRSRAQDFLSTQGDGNHFAYIGRIQFTEAQRAAIDSASAVGRGDRRRSACSDGESPSRVGRSPSPRHIGRSRAATGMLSGEKPFTARIVRLAFPFQAGLRPAMPRSSAVPVSKWLFSR